MMGAEQIDERRMAKTPIENALTLAPKQNCGATTFVASPRSLLANDSIDPARLWMGR